MKRRTKIVWGSIAGGIALAATIFWFRSDLIRRPGASLESVLANAGRPDAPQDAPQGPSAEQDWVVRAVRDATGRELAIEGAFDAYLLPLPGLLIGRASLSNSEGFGNEPFASIEGMELRVGALAPFARHVEVERAAIAGLRLNLARSATGEANWTDARRAGGADNAAGPTSASGSSPAAGDSGGTWTAGFETFEITDAEISLEDAGTGRSWKLSGFELLATGVRAGEAFPLSYSFAFERGSTAISIESALRALPSATSLELRDLSFAIGGVDPGDLAELFGTVSVSGDHAALVRAGASSAIEFSGGGSVDYATRELAIGGELRLADGSSLPLTIGGTLGAPGIRLGP